MSQWDGSFEYVSLRFFLFDFLSPGQKKFCHVGKGLSRLNQYKAEDKVSCSNKTTQWPLNLETSTLPLGHHAPSVSMRWFFWVNVSILMVPFSTCLSETALLSRSLNEMVVLSTCLNETVLLSTQNIMLKLMGKKISIILRWNFFFI